MLGYFFYVGGAFRWIDEGVFSAMSVTKISTRLPYISSLEAQMLLLQSTPPVTPPLVRKEGISNTVMLDVIIDVLGQVRSASILSGDLVLGTRQGGRADVGDTAPTFKMDVPSMWKRLSL